MSIPLPRICYHLLLLLPLAVVSLSDTVVTSDSWNPSSSESITSLAKSLFHVFQQLALRTVSGDIGLWQIMQIAGICATLPSILYLRNKFSRDSNESEWKSVSSKRDGETDTPMEKGKQATPIVEKLLNLH